MKKRKRRPAIGLLGFLGFLGFRYFATGEVANLFYFAFFGYFGFFFIGKLSREMPDERYKENRERARSRVLMIPAIALFIIGWSCGYPVGTREFMVAVSALGFASTLIAYSALFYYYERN